MRLHSIASVKKFFNNNKTYIFSTLATIGIVGLDFALWQISDNQSSAPIVYEVIEEPKLEYGFNVDSFTIVKNEIQNGQFLGTILSKYKVDYQSIDQLVKNTKEVFDIQKMRAGKPYAIVAKDTASKADYFVYEPNQYKYYLFDLNKLKAEEIVRPVDEIEVQAGGRLTSSLWNALVDQDLGMDIAAKMEDVFQWSLDFHHLQKNDAFKLVYNQHYVNCEKAGTGDILAAWYKTGETEFYAIYYPHGNHAGYYDLEGKPLKTAFLKAPVKYARISSYYNKNRLHPILKYRRPHLGTDYAAPYGTPIIAIGSGVVSRAGYTKGNGNFVKIRHDDTYETQYLHMQNFADGIKKGVHVKQGQVIGYVGSTGLATGPHVCFRFWKNGQQVNHLKMKFPPSKPLPEEEMPAFEIIKEQLLNKLNGIEVPVEVVPSPSL